MKTMATLVTMFAMALGGCASETAPTEDEKTPAEGVKVPVDEDSITPSYGSTYNSNCYCLFCVKYCDVDGKTVKSGTCC